MLNAHDRSIPAVPARIDKVHVEYLVNGRLVQCELEPWTTLLDLLRDGLGLTGTKKGCDHGKCGACTVLVDGKRINSCLALACSKDGAEIRTIEGFATSGSLHPLQAAFMERDAFQCGYCTPGQICSAQGLLNEELTDQTRSAVDDYLRVTGRKPGQFLFAGRGDGCHGLTTRQSARLVHEWVASMGSIRRSSELTPATHQGGLDLPADGQSSCGPALARTFKDRKHRALPRNRGRRRNRDR